MDYGYPGFEMHQIHNRWISMDLDEQIPNAMNFGWI